MSKILGISGRKQSGKGVTLKLIEALNRTGHVRDFSFATPLKEFCRDVLGLTHEQVFGADADKNTAVPHLRWENLPFPVYVISSGEQFVSRGFFSSSLPTSISPEPFCGDGVQCHTMQMATPRSGVMTAREVLQIFGTDICRHWYPNVWADATIRAITSWHQEVPNGVAVIPDVRFPNEVNAIQKAGGMVIRLTRSPFDDPHESEHQLDEDRYDWGNFDFILDNSTLSIREQCEELLPVLRANRYVYFETGGEGYATDVLDFIERSYASATPRLNPGA